MVKEFEPNILGFLCNWCSYAGADLAGTSRMKYPANLKSIRGMCSGRVEPFFVLEALRKGVDGVLIAGCHPGDCHYQSGNYKTNRRVKLLKKLLEELGIDPKRVQFEYVSASEGQKFASIVTEFVAEIKKTRTKSTYRTKRKKGGLKKWVMKKKDPLRKRQKRPEKQLGRE